MFLAHSPFPVAPLAVVAALVCFFFSLGSAATAADSVVTFHSVVAGQSNVSAVSAVPASAAPASAAKPQPALPPDVVARVNGQDINRVELADKLLKYYSDQALARMVQEAAIRQEAQALGVTATDQDLDRAENDFYAYGTMFRPGTPLPERKESWTHTLLSRGQTAATFRHDLEADVLLGKLVARRINITDEELQAEFKSLFKKGSPGENVKFEDVKAGLVDRLTKERTKTLRPQVIAEIMKKADIQRGDLVPQEKEGK